MSSSYWSVARLQLNRAQLALHCLNLREFTVYYPLLRVGKTVHGRRITTTPPPFPGYVFIAIQNGRWWDARWSPGIISLILDGDVPAKVPDAVIDEIKRREVGGLITLTQQGIKRGDRVRILRGPFEGYLAIYHDSKPRDRIEVLLQLLGSSRRATLESLDVELAK
jgi:transcriptional antiterminator RfaH